LFYLVPCWLIRLYAWSGQRSAARRQYESCVQILEEELGVSSEEETVALYQAAVEHRELPSPAQTAVPVETDVVVRPRHNLPAQVTPFVERETVLNEIGERLADPACRLLTLVGPGGSGKTRLAIDQGAAGLAVRSKCRDRYPGAVRHAHKSRTPQFR
jgi:predicted ribonuclease YlaK